MSNHATDGEKATEVLENGEAEEKLEPAVFAALHDDTRLFLDNIQFIKNTQKERV